MNVYSRIRSFRPVEHALRFAAASIHHLLSFLRLQSPFPRPLSPVTCLRPPVSCPLSPVPCPLSPAPRPLSPVPCLLTSALLLLAALPSPARVSQKIPADSHAARVAASLGWELAQRSEMDFGGIQGETLVWSADGTAAQITARLRDFHTNAGLSNAFFHGEAMAWGLAAEGDDIHRYLIADSGPGRGTHVYLMTQPARATPSSPRGEAGHRLEGVPAYPGSEPGLYLADLTTGTATEVSKTAAEPAAVLEYMDSAAVSKGWSPVSPAGGSMRLFTKGRHVMMVSVYTDGGGMRHIVRVRRTASKEDGP